MGSLNTPFSEKVGIEVPLICGAMYPCSNPELIAAVSEAGGIGIIQPMSLTHVYGHDFRDALKLIKKLTSKPFGMNVLLEKSSKRYEDRMKVWVDIALEEGCRFFITALGNPKWVVDKVHAKGGIVYHDVTERKWALKAKENGVDGLICVNNRAGGHAGSKDPAALLAELSDLGLPLVCAGGIGDEQHFCDALKMGYAGVQMGTRFIATTECKSHDDYKQKIVDADENDIVQTERVTGIPLSVIRTPMVERVGLKIGPIQRWMFKNERTKKWIRIYYNIWALQSFKRSNLSGLTTKDYYQAGKSVAGIHKVESAGDIVKRFAEAANKLGS